VADKLLVRFLTIIEPAEGNCIQEFILPVFSDLAIKSGVPFLVYHEGIAGHAVQGKHHLLGAITLRLPGHQHDVPPDSRAPDLPFRKAAPDQVKSLSLVF
jgi:hypothetical protein